MGKDEIETKLNSAIDALAAIEHERWAHWQRFMHSKGSRQPDGSMIIPAELVSRWEKQIEAPYDELSNDEKQSDRDQVMKYLPAVIDALVS